MLVDCKLSVSRAWHRNFDRSTQWPGNLTIHSLDCNLIGDLIVLSLEHPRHSHLTDALPVNKTFVTGNHGILG